MVATTVFIKKEAKTLLGCMGKLHMFGLIRTSLWQNRQCLVFGLPSFLLSEARGVFQGGLYFLLQSIQALFHRYPQSST